MTALKSLSGRTGVVCDITHLWPYPTLPWLAGGAVSSEGPLVDAVADWSSFNTVLLISSRENRCLTAALRLCRSLKYIQIIKPLLHVNISV